VHHGYLPEREITTGIGPVIVRCPLVCDRVGEGAERILFSWAILPGYVRWPSRSCAFGRPQGEFEEALIALLGKDAGGLSAATKSGG
jgi:hypothetical protein